MRLFFAVELPAGVQAALARLRPDGDERDYRWVDPALMHVTLAFLGEQPLETLDTLAEVGHVAAQRSPPGVLRLGAAGHFGSSRAPRVLWVDLAGDVSKLRTLQANLTQALETSGFPTEDRAFRAHITLARRREAARGGPPADWPPQVQHMSFKLHTLTLMQSKLSPRGATYLPVSTFTIGS